MYGSIVSGAGIAKQLNEENKKKDRNKYIGMYRCKVAVSCLTLFFCLVQTGSIDDTPNKITLSRRDTGICPPP